MLGEQEADRRERGVDLSGLLRERHVGDVELSERARAGEWVEIESRRARRVLRTPPRVDRCGVADDPWRPLRQAIDPAGRTHVRDVDREAGRCVRQAIGVARSDAAPRHRRRRLGGSGRAERCDHRKPDQEPLHTEKVLLSGDCGSSPARSRSLALDRSGLSSRLGRARRSARVRGKALSSKRLPVLPVGHDDVLAADVAGGDEKGEAHAGRHLEQRPLLACGRAPEPR